MNNALKLGILVALGLTVSACFDGSKSSANNPPTAMSVDLTTQTEVVIKDKLAGSDPDGDAISFSVAQQPTLGSLAITLGGGFTYQPFDEVTGSDSFTYTVRDAKGLEASGTVGITIEALPVSSLSYTRDAYNLDANAMPLSVNGRAFMDDGLNQTDYQDLVDGGSVNGKSN